MNLFMMDFFDLKKPLKEFFWFYDFNAKSTKFFNLLYVFMLAKAFHSAKHTKIL